MAARLTTYLVVAIVATTLIAGLIVGAQRDDTEGPVDLIVHNAKVYVGDGDGTMAEAVAVRGNQILKVGSNREINRLRRPQTTVIDAKGAAVLPGFNDAHVRLVEGGLTLRRVDLLGAATVPEIEARIRAWADANPDEPWIVGRGWNAAAFGAAQPERQILDAISEQRPVYLVSEDGHSAWVNSSALKLAGITKRAPAASAGVVRDARTGEPTGVLREGAMALVSQLGPQPGREDRARAIRAAIKEAHRLGVTSMQDVAASAGDIEMYAELRRSGDLDARIYAALVLDGPVDEPLLTRLDSIWKEYADDALLKTGAVAVEVDGGIDSRTAAMLEPYADAATRGQLKFQPDDLNRFFRLLDGKGWQILALSHGDAAVRVSLDALAHAARSNPAPPRGRRHRVEQAEAIHPDDVPRFGRMGVLASLQPSQADPTAPRIEEWTRALGSERTARLWPVSTVSAQGRLAIGSGWPAASLNPFRGIHTAVTRTGLDGLPEGGWTPSQRIKLATAIDAYTSGAAHASFDEQRKGSLTAGMLADLVVLSNDIFDAPSARLASTTVAVTIFDGKVVYQKDARGTN
jgi:predicted amidohydrolase YtcJ